jgi:hypothetical protein
MACQEYPTPHERYYTDAMARVLERCEWLLAEAMTLRVELLPDPRGEVFGLEGVRAVTGSTHSGFKSDTNALYSDSWHVPLLPHQLSRARLLSSAR